MDQQTYDSYKNKITLICDNYFKMKEFFTIAQNYIHEYNLKNKDTKFHDIDYNQILKIFKNQSSLKSLKYKNSINKGTQNINEFIKNGLKSI